MLSQCTTVAEVKDALKDVSLVNINFSEKLPLSPLHWLMADKTGESIVVESTLSGLHVYDNPVHVLTNNPEFPDSYVTYLKNRIREDLGFDQIPVMLEMKSSRKRWENRFE